MKRKKTTTMIVVMATMTLENRTKRPQAKR
jgi:hypothetical protein